MANRKPTAERTVDQDVGEGRSSRAMAGAAVALVKVRATQMGYYDLLRRRVGDVFTVPLRLFSPKWMERVDPDTPELTTSGREEMRRQHDEILQSRIPASGTTLVDEAEPTGSGNPIKA